MCSSGYCERQYVRTGKNRWGLGWRTFSEFMKADLNSSAVQGNTTSAGQAL